MLSSSCADISRGSTVPVTSSRRSDSVDLPWSICATMQKLRTGRRSMRVERITAPQQRFRSPRYSYPDGRNDGNRRRSRGGGRSDASSRRRPGPGVDHERGRKAPFASESGSELIRRGDSGRSASPPAHAIRGRPRGRCRSRSGSACGKLQPGGGAIGLGHVARQDQPLAAALDRGVGDRDCGDQRLRVRVQRVVVELVRRGQLNDLAQVHHRDAVADVTHDREVVSDEQVGQPEVRLQVLPAG